MEDRMKLSSDMSVDVNVLDRILAARPRVTATDLSPLLQEIQAGYGYLPPDVLLEMSRRTGIPASQIYGVATFYEQFHLEPHAGTRSAAVAARPATSKAGTA
jgi:NADH:ubiquinone oxidoreductase subunit E